MMQSPGPGLRISSMDAPAVFTVGRYMPKRELGEAQKRQIVLDLMKRKNMTRRQLEHESGLQLHLRFFSNRGTIAFREMNYWLRGKHTETSDFVCDKLYEWAVKHGSSADAPAAAEEEKTPPATSSPHRKRPAARATPDKSSSSSSSSSSLTSTPLSTARMAHALFECKRVKTDPVAFPSLVAAAQAALDQQHKVKQHQQYEVADADGNSQVSEIFIPESQVDEVRDEDDDEAAEDLSSSSRAAAIPPSSSSSHLDSQQSNNNTCKFEMSRLDELMGGELLEFSTQ